MLGTVIVGLFYRQLVSRVRTTAGQESPGSGAASDWLSQAHVRMRSDDTVDLRDQEEVGRLGATFVADKSGRNEVYGGRSVGRVRFPATFRKN